MSTEDDKNHPTVKDDDNNDYPAAKDDENNNDVDDNYAGGPGAPGNDRRACAACKYNRKKCVKEECAMWKHFPAEKVEEFAAVQKIFGLKNLTKNIKDLDGLQQEEAVKGFEWEAMCWKHDQVHGPLGQYYKLERENKWLKAALCNRLEDENKLLKRQQQQAHAPSPPNIESSRMCSQAQSQSQSQSQAKFQHVYENNFLHCVGERNHNVRVGPIMRPLGFQGSVAHQAYPFDPNQSHAGPGTNMGAVVNGAVNNEQAQPGIARNHLRLSNDVVGANGILYPRAMPYYQQYRTSSPLCNINQIGNQYNPASTSSTLDTPKKIGN